MMDVVMILLLFVFAVAMQVVVFFMLVWLLRKRQTWPFIIAAIKGRGSLFIKSHIDRTISINYTDKPINVVNWKVKDKATGKSKIIRTFIKQIYHTLKGTGINVHFCPVTYPTNIDINAKEKAVLDVEKTNALMMSEYMQGKLDASNFQKLAGLNIEHIQIMLMVITVLMLGYITWLVYNVQVAIGS